MKKIIYSVAALMCIAAFTNTAKAQLTDEQNVNITLDLQPVLKLDMSTSGDINFAFNTIAAYAGGITKYGATYLKVSSTVNWVLYAVGTSQQAQSAVPLTLMDNPVNYGGAAGNALIAAAAGALGVSSVPLDALELHQYQINSFAAAPTGFDYSPVFPTITQLETTPPALGANYNDIDITAAGSPYDQTLAQKFLEGGNGGAGGPATAWGQGGSWLTSDVVVAATNGAVTPYNFIIDYRILPGLPVVFPASTQSTALYGTVYAPGVNLTAASYALPGVYTMDVKYVLEQAQ